jgi:hypothetical protein
LAKNRPIWSPCMRITHQGYRNLANHRSQLFY